MIRALQEKVNSKRETGTGGKSASYGSGISGES